MPRRGTGSGPLRGRVRGLGGDRKTLLPLAPGAETPRRVRRVFGRAGRGALALAASRMTATAAYSDDPAVSALLATLSTPVALTVGLSAIAYGVEGTLIGAGRVGYLGRTHARDFRRPGGAQGARTRGGGFAGGLRGARRGVVDLGGVPGLADSATLGALTTREAVRAAGEGRGVGGGSGGRRSRSRDEFYARDSC